MYRASLRSGLFAGLLALMSLFVMPALAQGTMVRVHTTQGPIDLQLLDEEAPVTVANFLAYVRAGDYQDVMFHRLARNFVLQAGGYRWPADAGCCQDVVSRGSIVNEFSPTRSNTARTVAMAKLGGDANSATSQWFINLSNNAGNLDNQNGGFTVFARVTTPGFAVASQIAGLPVVRAASPFGELPVVNYVSGNPVRRENAVLITAVTVFPARAQQTDSDRLFNYLEAAYPQVLSPSAGAGGVFEGYTYRYYPGSHNFLAVRDGRLWYLAAEGSAGLIDLGSIADWLSVAQGAGY